MWAAMAQRVPNPSPVPGIARPEEKELRFRLGSAGNEVKLRPGELMLANSLPCLGVKFYSPGSQLRERY